MNFESGGLGLLLLGIALVVGAIGIVAGLLARRSTPVAAMFQSMEGVVRDLGQLRAEVAAVARSQDDLRAEAQRAREASIRELADAAQGIRSEIGTAHRVLAEVKALEQGRARQLDQAADSLRRLEAIVAGAPTRGAAGENILLRALAQLPPDLLESNVAFSNKIVEYAIRLPGGRYLPIDSKWTSAQALERLAEVEDAAERRKLVDQIVREVRSRVKEMTKYLDPERTASLGILAVPDAAYVAAPEAHAEGYREGVLLVPYSLALPYVLTVYRLAIRFGTAIDTDQIAARLRSVGESLRRMEEEMEGRLSRGLVQVENARDALRDHVSEARRTTERLLRSAETADAEEEREPRLAVADLN